MPKKELQKSAELQNTQPLPKEVLNPLQTAKLYTFHTFKPSDTLAAFVDYYWIMRWDLTDRPPFIAEVIPSPYTNLTFMPEGARVTGVTTGKYTYELKGQGAIIGAKFKPGGLYAFIPKNMHELTNTFVPAKQFFTKIDATYNEAILTMPDKKAVHQLESLLLTQKPKVSKNLTLVTNTLEYIESTSQPRLPQVIEHSGLSERRLQEIFREHVGVGLKWVVLRARLIKAAELAATAKNPNWTTVAQDLGYADQSHFINDFKRVIGKTPAQYAAEISKQLIRP